MNPSTESVEKVRPVRCLVIQLARLGDTLQSLMALRAAKQLYPQLEIYFLAREKFAAAANRVQWIEKVITLPTDALLGPVLTGDKTEVQALGDIARWIAPLIKNPWDILVNWSFSEASSFLTGILPSRVKLGYTRRRDSSFYGVDGWSHYIQAIVQGSVSQNIHLTDILTTQLLTALQIHIGEPAAAGNTPVTSKVFFNPLQNGSTQMIPEMVSNKKWIAIQLGCGQEAKTWNAVKWANLCYHIIKRNPEYGFALLGGKEDQPKAQVFLKELFQLQPTSSSTILNLTGQTNFDLWSSVVSKSQWLFSGDTAAIHLASVLGTRVLNISVGPVRFAETGPYGNGHYVISSGMECQGCQQGTLQSLHTCHDDVTPEAAYSVWSYGTLEWSHFRQMTLEKFFAQLGWGAFLDTVRIYRSRIRNAQDGGGVVYESVVKQPLRLSGWTGMVMGHIARSWYCGWTPPIGQEILRETVSPALIQKLRQLQESAEVLSKIFIQASQTAGKLNKKSSTLRSESIMGIKDREELQDLGKALHDLETLVERVVKTEPTLFGFSQMAKVLMHNLKGNQLADLGRETANSYRQLHDGVEIFKEWIKYTLALVKPVAIRSSSIPIDFNSKPNGKDL